MWLISSCCDLEKAQSGVGAWTLRQTNGRFDACNPRQKGMLQVIRRQVLCPPRSLSGVSWIAPDWILFPPRLQQDNLPTLHSSLEYPLLKFSSPQLVQENLSKNTNLSQVSSEIHRKTTSDFLPKLSLQPLSVVSLPASINNGAGLS